MTGAGFDVLTTGGRRFSDGRLVRTRLGADPRELALPGGQTVKTSGLPSGELLAARRASGAPSVTVTSALAPTAPAVRAVLPLLGMLLSVPAVRRLAVRGMARMPLKAAPRPRRHSWGHAVVTWPDGAGREGWVRAGDGMDYTADIAAETAVRLAAARASPVPTRRRPPSAPTSPRPPEVSSSSAEDRSLLGAAPCRLCL